MIGRCSFCLLELTPFRDFQDLDGAIPIAEGECESLSSFSIGMHTTDAIHDWTANFALYSPRRFEMLIELFLATHMIR